MRVNKVTEKLFKVANTPQEILKLTAAELCHYLKPLGLFKTKAANVLKTCMLLVTNFNSQVPKTLEDLQILPGVGRKTANVVLNIIWQQPTIAVDTHVLRVSNRIGLVLANEAFDAEVQLLNIIPEEFIMNVHNWLILHGRYICKAINPKCNKCLITDLCKYYQNTSQT